MQKILRRLKELWSQINSSDPYNSLMRIAARVSIGVACLVIGKIRGPYDGAPYAWLSHYLIGNGSPKRLEGKLLEDLCVKEWLSSRGGLGQEESLDLCISAMDQGFYVVGGMTVRITRERQKLIVSGTDHYDWHGLENGYDAQVPFSLSILPKLIHALWPLFYEFSIINGDRASIIDSFWSYLGGRSFDTLVDFEMPAGELDTALPTDS